MAQRDRRDSTGGKVTVVDPALYTPVTNAADPSAGIVTGQPQDWFGPLNPQRPSAPPEVAGRQLDFPSGYNLQVFPRAYESVKFDDLRALADGFDVLRTVIETRKDQMARLQWGIKARVRGGKPVAKSTDPRVATLEAFFRRPDKEHAWGEWLRMLLEDMFVLDAPAIYKRRTRGGQLYSLEPIDGATIKRVIDDYGRTPAPPAPAFQQALHGLPAVNYTTNDLIYRPRNPRTNKVYGYGPVEQIIMTVNIALRRQVHTLQYFTEGNIPEALVSVPDAWTADQIKAFQEYFDTEFAGQTGARRHMKFVPGAVANGYKPTKEPELKGVFDEWLARVVCYAFSISPQPFVSSMNRATAQTAKETSLEEGLGPTQDWVKNLIDDIISEELNEPDFEFQWAEEDETNPTDQEAVLSGYTKTAIMSIDEARDKLGLDALPNGAGKMPMALTPTGYVPLDAFDQQQAQSAANAKASAEALANRPVVAAPPAAGEQPPKAGEPPVAAKPDAKAEEVGKAADAPFVKKAIGPIAYPRRATRRVANAMVRTWNAVFSRQVANVAKGIRGTLFKAAASDEERQTADAYSLNLDLSLTSTEMADVTTGLSSVASESGNLAFAQLGTDDMFDQINDRAVAWAKDHAATLVSQISDTTRDLVRQAIAQGTADGLSSDEIADNIEELAAFSHQRSTLIAHTEIANANSRGALVGYQVAKDSGVAVKKAWLLADDDVDDECADNADAGPIDLEDAFPSGADAPLAHPNCRCALQPVVGDDE